MDAPSIASVPEHELVEMLFGHTFLRDLAVPPATPPPVSHRLRVTPQQLGLAERAFGDIDSLVLSRNDASSARAVEYKRIKVTTQTFVTGRPNKLQELQKAGDQVNAVARAGLSRVWLQVIVVTDAREVTGGQHHLVPGVFQIRELVKSTIPFDQLHPAVGVHVTHLAQAADRPVTDAAQFGGDIVRSPTPQVQPGALTAAIQGLFADEGRRTSP
jgi:hypothetical protein